jgi:chitodextrinase
MIRLDYPKVRGYLVRIGYRRTKTGWTPKFKGYFSDTRYGTKAKARAAAEAWLSTLLRTGRPPKAPAGRPSRTQAQRRRTSQRTA